MSAQHTILIVDDEPDTVELCGRILHDHDLITAFSAAEARKKVFERRVTVALVDQRMPEMTGLDFFVELGKTHPDSARVVMTGYTDLDDIVSLINTGRIYAFVVKPWNNHELKQTVEREAENATQARLIRELNKRIQQEHNDMLSILRELDPAFTIPASSDDLNRSKQRLRSRVTGEVERLFLKQLFPEDTAAAPRSVAELARAANMNRTFMYRLLERHGFIKKPGETSSR